LLLKNSIPDLYKKAKATSQYRKNGLNTGLLGKAKTTDRHNPLYQ